MNQSNYLAELKNCLRRLPEPDRSETLAYYEEYFSEGLAAGRSEEQIITALGDPKELAHRIMLECAEKELGEDNTSPDARKVMRMTLLAAVLALSPLSWVLFTLVLVLFITWFAVLLSLAVSALSILIASVPLLVGAFAMLFLHIRNFLLFFGAAVLCFGIGTLACVGIWRLCSLSIKAVAAMGRYFLRLARKDDNKTTEKNPGLNY